MTALKKFPVFKDGMSKPKDGWEHENCQFLAIVLKKDINCKPGSH